MRSLTIVRKRAKRHHRRDVVDAPVCDPAIRTGIIEPEQHPENAATTDGKDLEITRTAIQQEAFWDSTAKYVVCAWGRRSGKTRGAAHWLIETCLRGENLEILWCDVAYHKIDGYITTCFLPILTRLRPEVWHKKGIREIRILSSTIHFASADRPDLLVGSGYTHVVVNEAGIQLFDDPKIFTMYILPMTLDYEGSRVFLIGTPRGLIDKPGTDSKYYELFRRGREGDPKVQSFQHSSYENPLLSRKDIEELEDEVAPRDVSQEIFAQFVDVSEVQIFNPDWWRYVDEVPEPAKIAKTFISLDTAYGKGEQNAESAATVWAKTWTGDYYCRDCWHDHVNYPRLVESVKAFITKYNPDSVIIEDKASGQSLIQTLKTDLSNVNIVAFEPHGDKESRAASITSYLQAGRVFLVRNSSWNKYFVNQHTVFPNGDLKDIVDTVSQALIWAKMGDQTLREIVGRQIIVPTIAGYSNTAQPLKEVLSLYK